MYSRYLFVIVPKMNSTTFSGCICLYKIPCLVKNLDFFFVYDVSGGICWRDTFVKEPILFMATSSGLEG